MLVRELISDGIMPLKKEDTGWDALSWMEDFRVLHLPLVDGKKLLGLISEYDIYNTHYFEEKIGKIPLSGNPIFVYDYQHAFDALSVLTQNQLTLLPVLDEHENYMGTVSMQALLMFVGNSFSISEPGGVVVLEMSINDYLLSEIAQIMESNDAKILSLMIHSEKDSTRIQVSLKLNKSDLKGILQTLNRYNYNIIASFTDNAYYDDLRDRYDAFMNYLNI
ncbi:MAG: CBS domain-containing protein [Lentimicrobiaceae bacterium]|jgi:CBS domain-containing protein|nr:CBS domain-containing protein [Lentimicrobiaceae bacterium]